MNLNDLLIIVVFAVSGEEFSGNLHLAVPYLMLEPIKDKLSSSYLREKAMAHSFGEQLQHLLRDTQVQIVAELGRCVCTVRDILGFETDDVIHLNTGPQDAVVLNIQDVPKFLGFPGIVKGNRAVQVSQLIHSQRSEA